MKMHLIADSISVKRPMRFDLKKGWFSEISLRRLAAKNKKFS